MKKLVLLISFCSFGSYAQSCFLSDLLATTPTESFTLYENGTVLDRQTGLMWSRCSFGQTWNNETERCDGGKEQLTWTEALQEAQQATLAGYDDWHLPNVKELSSLVERQCVDPAINAQVFPDTAAQNYWTNSSGISDFSMAWAVAFYSGKNNLKSKSSDLYLRLVRYGQ